ncbi:MAG: glycosyltransferase family 2 protein [Bacteroidales bacterium]
MNKISVVINTYNAEKFLTRVLDSVQAFDEIVICDMESSDNTITIAQSYDCKIVTFPNNNYKSAEPARNFAIQSASNRWVLVVDADELVTPELREYLYRHIAKDNPSAGLYIPRKNFIVGRFMRSYYPDYILRFFKRDGSYWSPNVHTMPTIDGAVEYIPKKRGELAFIHLANDSYYDIIRKMNTYTENERIKRRKKYHFIQLFYMPAFRFIKRYFFKGGFREGKIGFIQAVIDANYIFYALSKIQEDIENEKSNKDIDKYL